MQASETILILRYLGKIPDTIKLLDREIACMDEQYNPVKSASLSGMPKAGGANDSTARLGEKMALQGTGRRIAECKVQTAVLRADETAIRSQLDRLDYRYKIVLEGRYIHAGQNERESWRKIAGRTHWSEATARRKERFALVRLGEMLDGVPMIEEVLARALDARD